MGISFSYGYPHPPTMANVIRRAGSPEPAAAGTFVLPQTALKRALRCRGRAVDDRPYGIFGNLTKIEILFTKLNVPARRDVGIAPYAKFRFGRSIYPFYTRRAAALFTFSQPAYFGPCKKFEEFS